MTTCAYRTGTPERQRLSKGENLAAGLVNDALSSLAGLDATVDIDTASSAIGATSSLAQCLLANVSLCSTTTSVDATANGFRVVAYNPLAYVRKGGEAVMVPVSAASTAWVVTDEETGETLSSQTLPSEASPASNAAPFTLYFSSGAIAPLSAKSFLITPATATATATTTTTRTQLAIGAAAGDDDTLVVSSDVLSLSFDKTTGRLASMQLVGGEDDEDVSIALDHGFSYYSSFASGIENLDLGDCDPSTGEDCPAEYELYSRETLHHHKLARRMGALELHGTVESRLGDSEQNSGAYIFRPDDADATPKAVSEGVATLEVFEGDVVTEVRQSFAPWINQTWRLFPGKATVELEWTIGPVPIEDGIGKEIVSKFSSSIASNGTVYTDSNGREFMRRVYNERPSWPLEVTQPVAGNYYPVNAAIYIEDDDAQLAIVVDRSEGGASLASGEVEMMVQRRLLADDSRGVGEPLNETTGITSYASDDPAARLGPGVVTRGKHYLMLHRKDVGVKHVRAQMERVFSPLVLGFGDAATSRAPVAKRAADTFELPANVKLLTLQALGETTVLVRLAHLFAVGEDTVGTLSDPVTVNAVDLLASLGLTAKSAVELSLTANQPLSNVKKLSWLSEEASVDATDKPQYIRTRAASSGVAHVWSLSEANGDVTLQPMEIRTFKVEVSRA